MESNSPNKAVIGIIVIALLVAAATAVIVLSANNTTQENTGDTTASVSPSTSAEATTSSTSTSTFKDGTYTAEGDYQTPGGGESIGVTVTLTSGVITDASVDQQGQRGESQEYQAKFASGFKTLVVGKKIDEVSLTRVAGSSLTSSGFNDALDAIENQAKA